MPFIIVIDVLPRLKSAQKRITYSYCFAVVQCKRLGMVLMCVLILLKHISRSFCHSAYHLSVSEICIVPGDQSTIFVM